MCYASGISCCSWRFKMRYTRSSCFPIHFLPNSSSCSLYYALSKLSVKKYLWIHFPRNKLWHYHWSRRERLMFLDHATYQYVFAHVVNNLFFEKSMCISLWSHREFQSQQSNLHFLFLIFEESGKVNHFATSFFLSKELPANTCPMLMRTLH